MCDFGICGAPADEYFVAAMTAALKSNPALKTVKLMPNWGYSWLRPPNGFLAEFAADAPFKADLFYTDMWAATAVARVDGYDGSKALEQGKVDAMFAKVVTAGEAAPSFTDSDTREWSPSLGDGKSFIGLFSTDVVNAQNKMNERAHMIVCRTSIHPLTYEEMENYFTKCEADGMTNRAVFADNPTTEAFSSLITRNRRRVVYEFAEALGLSVRFRKYSNGSVPYNIANLAFETETNFVHFTDHDTMLFYSECTRTSNVTQGLVVNRAPLLGPLVFLGPNHGQPGDSAIFGGNKWYNAHEDAFPVDLGLHKTTSTWREFGKVGFSKSELAKVVLCDGELEGNKMLLRSYPYRERDGAWQDAEARLGYEFKGSGLTVRTCSAILVKLNS